VLNAVLYTKASTKLTFWRPEKRFRRPVGKKLLSSEDRDELTRGKRMTLESSKNLGGIGALLMFIGVLPYISFYGILSFVGLILVLVALYGLANYYKEGGIFNNALYGVITAIVGVVVVIAIAITTLVGFLTDIGINIANITDWTALSSDWQSFLSVDVIMNYAVVFLLDLVVLFVFVVITAILLRKSLGLLSAKSGVGMFGTTGTILLVGAILTIIAIGLLLMWIALLLLAVAFFSIKPEQAPLPPPP
jgi:uncharacterized membrane protein